MLERILTLELVRVTERAAVAAARLRGRGDEKAADQAAVDAMRRELNKLPIDGTVVIGEGERDEAPMLFIGEEVGTEERPEGRHRGRSARGHDAVRQEHAGRDRRHGHGRRRHAAQRARRLHGQDRHRPGLSEGRRRSRRAGRARTSARSPRPRASKPDEITALILDRPRHAELIAAVRKAGAAVRLITDGDVAGVIHTTEPDATGIDIYLGIGGAPEGVLAAAALRCIGGQMQGRLVLDTEEKRERARKMGINDPRKKYAIEDMVHGDCLFAATGVTDGALLQGVRFSQRRDRDRDGGDALGHRHGALDPRRAPPAREVRGQEQRSISATVP